MTSNVTLANDLIFKYDRAVSEEKADNGFTLDSIYFVILVFIPLVVGLIIMVNHLFSGGSSIQQEADLESVPPYTHSGLERTRSPCLLEYKLSELKRKEHEEEYSSLPPVLHLKPNNIEDEF